MSRRTFGVAVVAVVLAAAYGCGSSGSDAIGVRTGTRPAALHAADAAPVPDTVAAAGLRTVSYRGVQFDVPADWPVYDLGANPSTCVRFDVHAVYLGRPGAEMSCPAGVVGRTDALLVEPGGDGHHGSNAGTGAADASSASVNGLQAEIADGGDVTYELDATFPSAGVTATLTYQDSDAAVQRILQSFRAVAG